MERRRFNKQGGRINPRSKDSLLRLITERRHSNLQSALRRFQRAIATNMDIAALDVLSDFAVFGQLLLSSEEQAKRCSVCSWSNEMAVLSPYPSCSGM